MTFAYPAFFYFLLLIPLIIGVAVLIAHQKKKQWSDFVADRLRKNLIAGTATLPRKFAFACLLIAMALFIAALARPQVLGEREKETSVGHNVVIVLDLSLSMDTRDIAPSRLEHAKTIIYELLEKLPHDRFAIVGFAGSPWLFVPMTQDHDALRESVQQLDTKSILAGGSDIAAAIKVAVETLKTTGQKNNGLVLISDGEEQTPDLTKTIADIKESNTLTFTIGIGTDQGDYIPDADDIGGKHRNLQGDAVVSRLQTKTLTEFANKTRGEYATAGSSSEIPTMMANFTQSLQAFEQTSGDHIVKEELHQRFTIAALFFLIASFLLNTSWKKAS